MTIVRWDPFRNVSTLQDRINRLFDDAFPRSRDMDEDVVQCAWRPAVDIYETGDAVVFKVELPGVKKEDVSVEVKDNVLTIKGMRAEEKAVDEENYYRRERCFGSFSRSFNLQHIVNPESIQAKFKGGLLEVTILKPVEEKPKQVSVKVE